MLKENVVHRVRIAESRLHCTRMVRSVIMSGWYQLHNMRTMHRIVMSEVIPLYRLHMIRMVLGVMSSKVTEYA